MFFAHILGLVTLYFFGIPICANISDSVFLCDSYDLSLTLFSVGLFVLTYFIFLIYFIIFII